MSNYISVKEFASMAGVSTQAIYQRIAKDLQSYCKEVDGKKQIDIAGLELFSESAACKALDKEGGEIAKPLQSTYQDKINEDLYKSLLKTIDILEAQLIAKDKQIESLSNALESAQKAATQAQQLHAGTIQRELIEAHTEPPETPQQPEPKRGFFYRLFNG